MQTTLLKPSDFAGTNLADLARRLREDETLAQTLPAKFRALITTLVDTLQAGAEVALVTRPEALTPAQAATLLGVSRAYVSVLLKNAALESYKVGAHHRIPLATVLALRDRRQALEQMRKFGYEAESDLLTEAT